MPSGKGRSKEDTWKESDLKKAIQGDKKERSSRREDDRRERRSDRDDDRRRRDRREDLVNGEDKDREHRRKERSSDKERRRDRDKDGERTREKSDRDKERRREREGESSGRERRERERSEKDKESSRDRERRRDRDGESTGKERRERDKRERDNGDSERQQRERESEKDRERRHRSRREHEGDDRRDKGKSKERDAETGSDERRKEKERRRRRDEGESSRHRDENRDQKSERSRERDHRDRRKERENGESRRHRDKSGERREKRREKDDRERRKDKHEVVPVVAGPSRGEAIGRAISVEEADTVDEEDIKKRKSSIIKTVEFNAEGEYNYDQEDFEEYEDDFENEVDDDDDTDLSLGDRNAGMQELLNAINLENATVSREGSKLSRSSDDDSKREPEVRPVTAKGRINFVAAKQKQISEKVASRTRKRGQELMHLIDLDVVVFEMFDLPPMNEYELYIKNFGRSDTKQAYVQCNDDNLEKEIQTEDIETRTMWTQNPAEDFAGCGDEKGSQDDTSSVSPTVDSVRLTRFLQTAGQACLVLLEEESAEQSNKIVKDKKEMTCSDGYIPLCTKQPYLTGRVLECLHVSPVQNHLLLTAYGPVTDQDTAASHKMSDSMKCKSIICLWNVNEPSAPQKILICESVPRCCCLSPSKATIAFAGLEDGSVVAWDLRESPSIHHSYDIDNNQVTFRAPTFSTAGVLSQDNHHSPVVSLLPVVMPGDSAKASTSLAGNLHSDDMLGLSFQLASLEENAVINIWVVVELGIADIAGSESDLGLAPGGKIKLIKSSSLPLEAVVRDVRKNSALQTYTMRFLPQDPNHFYVGTDSGYVLHRVRHGGRAPPKTLGPQIECLVDVTALDVSPWQLPCILAGNRDGSIRLYNINSELPLNTWTHSTQGSSILSVQWSNSIPSVFYVLDANSTLYIWDLLKNDSEPVSTENVKQGSVISFEVSSDYTATGVGVPGRNAELILGYKNGSVEVHKISERFAKASPDELDKFHEYLEGAL